MFPIISFFGLFQIPTYFLVISVGCSISLWLFYRSLVTRGDFEKQIPAVLDSAMASLVIGFVGARLLHVVYEDPAPYIHDVRRVLYFWNGGFVYYGGFLTGAVGAYVFFLWRTKNLISGRAQQNLVFLKALDSAALALAVGYAIGRFACFLNGCCYGSHCVFPWAIDFKHPTQLYAIFCESLTIFLILRIQKSIHTLPGDIFWSWLFLHGCGRLIMERFRDDPRGPSWLSLSLGTWLSLLVCAIAGFWISKHYRKWQRR
jgi:phosphatidylglycerol:prolipoprotein diacylglycerol transferase